jgi:hypothetical protein
MMLFFMFGPRYDAWALGNEIWTAWSDNLDPTLKQLFESSHVSGKTIDWVSTAADGKIYMPCFPVTQLYGGHLYVNKLKGPTVGKLPLNAKIPVMANPSQALVLRIPSF